MIAWLKHVEDWKDCQRCPLAQQRGRVCLARSEVVDGVPNLRLPCDVLLVGEAPGMSEDALGLPFVGPAGVRLDLIVGRALPPGITYAMTNLVACFPREAKARGENEPERGEILACRPRVVEFVNMAQPRLIVAVGKLAAAYMGFDRSVPMAEIEHPAHILRMPVAQQGMATQRAVVVLRNAVEDAMSVLRTEWKLWGAKHANKQTVRDEIPF